MLLPNEAEKQIVVPFFLAAPLCFCFLVMPTAHESSWDRHQTCTTAATQAVATTMFDPQPTVPSGNSVCFDYRRTLSSMRAELTTPMT